MPLPNMLPRGRISSASVHLCAVLLVSLATLTSSAGDGGGGVGGGWKGNLGSALVGGGGGEGVNDATSGDGGGTDGWSGGFLRRRLCGGGGGRRREGQAWCEAFVGVGIRRESVVLYDVIVGLYKSRVEFSCPPYLWQRLALASTLVYLLCDVLR